MLRPTDKERIAELERRIARLDERLADLEGPNWVKTGEASKKLYLSQQTIDYRLRKFPEIYKEGVVWRWNPNGEHRLINLREWRKVDPRFAQARYKHLPKSKIMKREHSRRKKA